MQNVRFIKYISHENGYNNNYAGYMLITAILMLENNNK